MAEGTYEYECMRSELLGIDKPNQEEFEKARSERLQREKEEQDVAEAALLESQEEALKGAGGKLDELNSILSSTQQKLNRFKQTACGSLSNIFGRGSVDNPDQSPIQSTSGSRRNTCAVAGTGTGAGAGAGVSESDDIAKSDALDDNDIANSSNTNSGEQPIIPTEKIRNAKMDIQKKMTSHLDKLDTLLNKAESAEISMSEQTKQMRKIAK